MVYRKTALATSILALAIAMSAGLKKYENYLSDPDIAHKIYFDIAGQKEKELFTSSIMHSNRLYDYLWKEDTLFREELKKEAEFFSQKYNLSKTQFDTFRQLPYFADREHFLAYLKSENLFLKKSLERGHFLDAAIAAFHLGTSEEKVNSLLEESDIQIYKSGSSLINFNIKTMTKEELEKAVMNEWNTFLGNEIREIKIKPNKQILREYGETKKRILDLAEKRQSQWIK